MALPNPTRLTSLRRSQPLPSLWKTKKSSSVTVLCVPPQKQGSHSQQQEDAGIMCEPCNGKGWLLCDFCQGQKTNVKAENNRIYRRCPSCKAIGYVLCSKCRVFKCVTFPDYSDGELVK